MSATSCTRDIKDYTIYKKEEKNKSSTLLIYILLWSDKKNIYGDESRYKVESVIHRNKRIDRKIDRERERDGEWEREGDGEWEKEWELES